MSPIAKHDPPARPSARPARGWLERIATSISAQAREDVCDGDGDGDASLVEPCYIDGKPALVYQPGLEAARPRLFDYLEQLARRNGLLLQRERRERERPVPRERRAPET